LVYGAQPFGADAERQGRPSERERGITNVQE